jgi:hypothetical protein
VAIGILEEEGADFIGGGWKNGAELAEGLAVGVEKFPPREAVPVIQAFGEGLALGVVESDGTDEYVGFEFG